MDLLSSIEAPRHDHGCKRLLRWPTDCRTTAVFGGPGDCYRYQLRQAWTRDQWPSFVMWLLMNPSGASIEYGDMTLLKTGAFSRRWGYGGQLIGNVCAGRFTNNRKLTDMDDPVGIDNMRHLLAMAATAKLIVVGHGKLPGRLQEHALSAVRGLRAAGHTLHVLRLSQDGTPYHPLSRGRGRLPDDVTPFVWDPV